jgi:hypothetical protein
MYIIVSFGGIIMSNSGINKCVLFSVVFISILFGQATDIQAEHSRISGTDQYYHSIPGTGLDFLLTEADIRSAGMGNVSAALTDNPAGFISNPARLADAQTFFFQGSTAKWLPQSFFDLGMRHYFFNAGFVINNIGAFGLAFQRFGYGKIRYTDESGYPLGELSPYEMAITLGYGINLTPAVSFGANFKLIRRDHGPSGVGDESIGPTATGLAFDFGFLFSNLAPNATYTNDNLSLEDHPSAFARTAQTYANPRSKGISIGICVQNIGADIKFEDARRGDPLPRNLKIGFAYRVMDTDPFGFLVAVDFNRSIMGGDADFFKYPQTSYGAELNLYRLIDLRVGYFNDKLRMVKPVTFGAGIGFDKVRFNVSRIPDFDDTGALSEMTFWGIAINF